MIPKLFFTTVSTGKFLKSVSVAVTEATHCQIVAGTHIHLSQTCILLIMPRAVHHRYSFHSCFSGQAKSKQINAPHHHAHLEPLPQRLAVSAGVVPCAAPLGKRESLGRGRPESPLSCWRHGGGPGYRAAAPGPRGCPASYAPGKGPGPGWRRAPALRKAQRRSGMFWYEGDMKERFPNAKIDHVKFRGDDQAGQARS